MEVKSRIHCRLIWPLNMKEGKHETNLDARSAAGPGPRLRKPGAGGSHADFRTGYSKPGIRLLRPTGV
jgi:hypothetical protein